MSEATSREHASHVPWKAIAIGVGVVGGLIAASLLLPLREWASDIVEWVRDLGLAGAFAYVLIYAVLATVAFPASILTMAAGFAYGPFGGLAVASPASVLAVALSFALAQTLFRKRFEKIIAEHPRLRAVETAVAEGAFRVAFLIRLSPIVPFALTNYSLGVMRIGFWRFVGASFLGMLPGALLYCYIGSTLETLTQVAEPAEGASTAQTVLFWAGLAATAVATVLVTRAAKKALKEKVDVHTDKDVHEDKNEET